MRGILFSVALHTLVVLAVALGLPWLTKPPANASRNITVDIVRLSDITRASKGEKPKPKTERKPDAERETTKKPVARDRRAEKRPDEPKPVKPKPPAPEPPKAAEAKPPAPEPPKAAEAIPAVPELPRTADEKPKPAAPAKTGTAERKTAPPARPKPVEKAAPAPKPKSETPQRVEIDPRALERQAEKPKKKLPAKKPETQMAKAVPEPEKKKVPPKKPEAPVAKPKKPEPPITKPTPKPVAKPKKTPEKKLETRAAGPAPKPEKKQAAPKKAAPKKAAKPEKPEKMVAKPKKKPERKPPETAKNAAPKIERQVAALPRMRPPAKPRPKTAAKKPRKTVKKHPAKEDPLDSVFKTVGKLKKTAEQSDRDRTSARTTAGVKTSARSHPMTLSEIEAVRRQIQPCWNFPVGTRDAESLRVLIRIWLNRDGSVRDAKVLDRERIDSDSKLRAAAEAGLRAVNNPRCSPLRLPPEKYDRWKVLTIDFDPSKLTTG